MSSDQPLDGDVLVDERVAVERRPTTTTWDWVPLDEPGDGVAARGSRAARRARSVRAAHRRLARRRRLRAVRVPEPAPRPRSSNSAVPVRRRHGRPRVGPRLPARPPAHRGAALGLDARLVRRLPRLPVLHGGPVAADRRPRRRALRRLARWSLPLAAGGGLVYAEHPRSTGWRRWTLVAAAVVVVVFGVELPYGTAFKLVTVLGVLVAAGVRVRLRAAGRPAVPGPGAAVGGQRAVPVRPQLHDLRRQRRLHARRRVRLLDQPVARAPLPRRGDPGPPHRASTAPSPRCSSPSPASAT